MEQDSKKSFLTETTMTDSQIQLQTTESEPILFKAVGVVNGEVKLGEDGINTITIDGKTYRLKYATSKPQVLRALKMEIKNSGNNEQRLIVYPRIIHFPKRDQPPMMYFELVGFEGSQVQDKGIFNELKDLEFKLAGLWQFIPVCRLPCISVFKNFTEERKLFIKSTSPLIRVRFMKPAHLPLSWRNSEVTPFRFNPKLSKEEQGRSKFVQVKAKLVPQRVLFEFIDQLAEPLDNAPEFLKAGKADKLAGRKIDAERSRSIAAQKTPKPIKKELRVLPKPARPIKVNQP